MFADEHQIFVSGMRRNNLNDFHEAASDEANSEDHDGGENKKAVTAHPAPEKFCNDDHKKRPQNRPVNRTQTPDNDDQTNFTHLIEADIPKKQPGLRKPLRGSSPRATIPFADCRS